MSTIYILVILLILLIQDAYAHPFILESDPKNLEQLGTAPDKIIITYSEPVELGFSYIRVKDSTGNRVDNDDTNYLNNDDTKLVATLKQGLPDDVYTVNTRVLSKVDGHIVDYSFTFIVGEAKIITNPTERVEVIYIPESLAKLPGIVGQYMLVGIGAGYIYLLRKIELKDHKLLKIVDKRLYIIGISIVIISTLLILSIQMFRLETALDKVLATGFGNILLIRLLIAFVGFALLPFINKNYAIPLIVGFALSLTYSIIGHAAALSPLAILIDAIHNILASIWIGIIFYLAFGVIPILKREGDISKIAIIIPSISKLVLILLGILIITGPTLLILIESDLNMLLNSSYGLIILFKIGLIGVMTSIGFYNQTFLHKKSLSIIIGKGEKDKDKEGLYKSFQRSLRVEAIVGLILLLSIAFLTNTGLPRVEYPIYTLAFNGDIAKDNNALAKAYNSTIVIEDVKVNLAFKPVRVGLNTFTLIVTDKDNNILRDLGDATLKLRELNTNTALVIKMNKIDQTRYIGNGTIPTNGKWFIEANIERTTTLSISTVFSALIKPDLDEMRFELTEYNMPFDTLNPISVVYKDNYIWISDATKPRLWRFNIDTKEFTSYTFNGSSSIRLAKDNNRIWFTDPLSKKIGYFDMTNEQFKIFSTYDNGLPTDIYVDYNNNIWITLIDKDTVVRFDPKNERFIPYKMPINGSLPTTLIMDEFGYIWITETAGRLAKLDPNTGHIEEFTPLKNGNTTLLAEPFALLLHDNSIWISEHIGAKITRFNPLLKTFYSYYTPDISSLPYGMVKDSYGNIWFAQHTLDKIGVLDPITGKVREVPISSPSWVQVLDIDDKNNIWFAEPRQAKIGMISIKVIPFMENEETSIKEEKITFRYGDIAPLLSALIVIISLLFVKNVHTLRRSLKYANEFKKRQEGIY